MILNFEH